MARNTDSSDEKLDPSLIHKKKARRRLVGAVAFLGAVGVSLPFILDSEPKSSTQEVQIRVPAREPLTPGGTAPVAPQAKSGAASTPVVPVVPLEPSSAKEGSGKDFPTPSRVEGKPTDSSPADMAKTDDLKKDDPKKDDPKKGDGKKDDLKKDAAKKDLASDGKKSDAKKSEPRKDDAKKEASKKNDEPKAYRVQIGAFSSEDGALEQLSKATKLGLKAYTEKISGSNGTKTRVRVGPFANREQAEQALAKLKLNGIDAALVAP